MAFESSLLSRQDIINAIRRIDADQQELHHSTVYDVKFEDRDYPPKELLRVAYRLATGEDIGVIYGGERVNRIFRDLDFEVVRKNDFWKLGCNWGRGTPSFYDLIAREKIVITVDDHLYKPGDMVLVTEGYTVYALALVSSELKPITSRPELRESFEEHQIPFESWLLFANAEWFELAESDIFQYKLQQGIRQVRKQEVIVRVTDIWENRHIKLRHINFYLKARKDAVNPDWTYPCMVLTPTQWDDKGYKTSFDLYFYVDTEAKDQVGNLKIIQQQETKTVLPDHFTQLGPEYLSLGQTPLYYRLLRTGFPYEYTTILKALNDCAFEPKLAGDFEQQPAFQTSLLRSSDALKIFHESGGLFDPMGEDISYKPVVFDFEYQFPEAAASHQVDFSFLADETIPNRLFCLIGKNGTGKTQFLAQLARKLVDKNAAGNFYPKSPYFSPIIAVSFSLFDNFDPPKASSVGYERISLKTKEGKIDEEAYDNDLWRAYQAILKSRSRKMVWLNAIRDTLELDFLDFNINDLESLATKQDFVNQLDKIFSSGQKITFHFFTRLLQHIDKDAIVIFDEPETHLHPNVAGRLLRTLHYVLDKFKAFGILATHSPVIVQEFPSRFIRVIERDGNIPNIFEPPIECLGENLSNISNTIFHVDEEKALYKSLLEDLLRSRSPGEVEQLFRSSLSLNARLYLQTIKRDDS